MKKIIFFTLLICFLLDYSFLPQTFSVLLGSGLTIVVLFVISFIRPASESFIWFLATGIVLDYFSSTSWGVFITTNILLFLIISLTQKKLLPAKPSGIARWLFFFGALAVYQIIFWLVVKACFILKLSDIDPFFLSPRIFIFLTTIYSIMAMIIYKILKKLEMLIGAPDKEIKITPK